MIQVLKAFMAAVLLTYVLGSIFSTQVVLSSLQVMGIDVAIAVRISATFQDLLGLTSSYLILITVALVLGLPVASGLSRLMPGHRPALFILAGFVAIVSIHLIMKAALGLTGIASTRTMTGLLIQGIAGAAGGYMYCLISSPGITAGPKST
jgi:hypothetical protein